MTTLGGERAVGSRKFAQPGVELVPLLALSAVTIGIVSRVWPVLQAEYPLSDGGLFYQMARDIQSAGYLLPPYTSYNGGDIPFAYPPLEIYIAALLDGIGVLPLLDIMKFAPLVASILTVGAFFLLSLELLSHRDEAVLATGAFALIPGAFFWPLMGGGLTRSWGDIRPG